jgi:excisionase family DNA binding protein
LKQHFLYLDLTEKSNKMTQVRLARKEMKSREAEAAEGLLSMAQAARELGITRQGVKYAIEHGYLQAVKVGPYRLVPRHAVEAYKKARPHPGPPKGRKLGPRK